MISNTKNLVQFIINNYIEKVDIAVDMTFGNGHDSKFIEKKLMPKKLYAFDIQKEAQEASINLLETGDLNEENFNFILDSHENIDKYIKDELDLVIYNLGYLPKGDHRITTEASIVEQSLEKILTLLANKGLIVITFYPGHEEGEKEAELIVKKLENLDQKVFNILKFDFINQVNKPPFVVAIEKRT